MSPRVLRPGPVLTSGVRMQREVERDNKGGGITYLGRKITGVCE